MTGSVAAQCPGSPRTPPRWPIRLPDHGHPVPADRSGGGDRRDTPGRQGQDRGARRPCRGTSERPICRVCGVVRVAQCSAAGFLECAGCRPRAIVRGAVANGVDPGWRRRHRRVFPPRQACVTLVPGAVLRGEPRRPKRSCGEDDVHCLAGVSHDRDGGSSICVGARTVAVASGRTCADAGTGTAAAIRAFHNGASDWIGCRRRSTFRVRGQDFDNWASGSENTKGS